MYFFLLGFYRVPHNCVKHFLDEFYRHTFFLIIIKLQNFNLNLHFIFILFIFFLLFKMIAA